MSTERRSLPRPGDIPLMARPALCTEVLRVMHARPNPGAHMSMGSIERDLAPRDFGVLDALWGLKERGLVDWLADAPYAKSTMYLTDAGKEWDPEQELEPLRFIYRVDRELALGTLADWAKAWEHGHYSSDVLLSDVLRTWDRHDPGYAVQVDRLTPLRAVAENDDYVDYRVWAAGEHTKVRIDGRA